MSVKTGIKVFSIENLNVPKRKSISSIAFNSMLINAMLRSDIEHEKKHLNRKSI